MQASSRFPSFPSQVVYSYLESQELLQKVACLSKQDRRFVKESETVREKKDLSLHFNGALNQVAANRIILSSFIELVHHIDLMFIESSYQLSWLLQALPERFKHEKIRLFIKRADLEKKIEVIMRHDIQLKKLMIDGDE